MDAPYATLLLDSRCDLGESILWCERREVLYWADILSAKLWRHDPASGRSHTWSLPESLGCLALAEDGRLLLGLAKGLYASDVESQLEAHELTLHRLAEVDEPLALGLDGQIGGQENGLCAAPLTFGGNRLQFIGTAGG